MNTLKCTALKRNGINKNYTADYIEKENAPKLLFFAEQIVKYPVALKTEWYGGL